MKRYWLRILILSSLVSMIALVPASAQQSKRESTPPEKLYTEAEALAATQAALDKAIPLAVQAAVAQKEGELAAANALAEWNREEARRQAARAGLWRAGALAGGFGIGGALVTSNSLRGIAVGLGLGALGGIGWYFKDIGSYTALSR